MNLIEKELRELDAWIAEHVMGWKCLHPIEKWEHEGPEGDRQLICGLCRSNELTIPSFSNDPAAAMEVLKKCQHLTDVVVYKTVQDKHGVRDDISDEAVSAETLELAVCLFAKKLFKK